MNLSLVSPDRERKTTHVSMPAGYDEMSRPESSPRGNGAEASAGQEFGAGRYQFARAPDGGGEGDAGAVGQVGVGRGVQHEQVGPGPQAQVPDVGAAPGAGPARGCRPHGFLGGAG